MPFRFTYRFLMPLLPPAIAAFCRLYFLRFRWRYALFRHALLRRVTDCADIGVRSIRRFSR